MIGTKSDLCETQAYSPVGVECRSTFVHAGMELQDLFCNFGGDFAGEGSSADESSVAAPFDAYHHHHHAQWQHTMSASVTMKMAMQPIPPVVHEASIPSLAHHIAIESRRSQRDRQLAEERERKKEERRRRNRERMARARRLHHLEVEQMKSNIVQLEAQLESLKRKKIDGSDKAAPQPASEEAAVKDKTALAMAPSPKWSSYQQLNRAYTALLRTAGTLREERYCLRIRVKQQQERQVQLHKKVAASAAQPPLKLPPPPTSFTELMTMDNEANALPFNFTF